MLHKNILAKSGLRLLDDTELETVSGGDIVVTGERYTDPWVTSFAGADLGFLMIQDVAQLNADGGGGGFFSPDAEAEDEWDPNGDDDGDEVLNQDEKIVVIAPVTADHAKIAHAIASQIAGEKMVVAGFVFGYLGLELSAAFGWAGLSDKVADGVLLASGAAGVPDTSDALNATRLALTESYEKLIQQDMVNNPGNYASWMINPFTGEPFDANSPPYNQND